jgi:HSP20 family protein
LALPLQLRSAINQPFSEEIKMSNALLYNPMSWMDRFFDDIERGNVPERTSYLPAVDIIEEKDAYHLRVELPGVKREDLKVEVKDNRLTLSGKKENAWENHKDGYRYFETRFGGFSRTFELPRNVRADAIEAKYDHGVLGLKIPKSEAAVAKSIQVL